METTPFDIRPRPITPGDQELCQTFDCGPEPYEREVSHFLRDKYWVPARKDRETVVLSFIGETGDLHGFGAWKIRDLKREGREDTTIVDIAYFGVSADFKGEKSHQGHSLAGQLYTAVETLALRDDRAAVGIPIHLVCDVRNTRGLAFWERRGFEKDERIAFPKDDISYWRMFRRS